MKKTILLTTIILFSISVFAQSFVILNALKQDISNTTISISGEINSTIKSQFYIANNATTSASVLVKKIENTKISSSTNIFCFNDQCYPPNIMQASMPITLQAGDTTDANGFYGSYNCDISGYSSITYIVYNANNTNDSTYATVTYNTTPLSVAKQDFSMLEFSNPYPNPTTSQAKINYNIPFVYNNATLVLRNIIGTDVKEINLSDQQGRLILDLNNINEGIYFYSLIIDGKVVLTRKLIKH